MKRGSAIRRRYGRMGRPVEAWDDWRTTVELSLVRRFVRDGMHQAPAENVAGNIVSNEDAKLKKLHARGVLPTEAAIKTIPLD